MDGLDKCPRVYAITARLAADIILDLKNEGFRRK